MKPAGAALIRYGFRNRDEMLKWAWIVVVAIILFFGITTVFTYYSTIKYQATYQAPSYDVSWQNAMEWVRTNTTDDSLFLHWWDYGYWVQTGGNRATVSDGGHAQGKFGGNGKIGRYVLTTPYPETAKSFMKTFNVTHLLIDHTDLGKYSAYSSIGDGDEISDRASSLPIFSIDESQSIETSNGTGFVYVGGSYLDVDITYNNNGTIVFLPARKAAIVAVTIELNSFGTYSQPTGVYYYNNQYYYLPVRYFATSSTYHDFGDGLNSTIYIFPKLNGQQLDIDGALVYLSEKTMNSLFVKLYLMNDPLNEYDGLSLVYSESQYGTEFCYDDNYYGQIKIWEVNISAMDDINVVKEFMERQGGVDDLDGIKFK